MTHLRGDGDGEGRAKGRQFMTEANRADKADAQNAMPNSVETLRRAAITFDWDGDNLDHLRRMMSRTSIDLETALQVFFNGAPGQYNMIAKSDLLPKVHSRCNLLDSIHSRIVCGFYLPDPDRGLGQAYDLMQDWIGMQDHDGQQGRAGRWVFDHALLDLRLVPPAPHIPLPPLLHETMLSNLKNRVIRLIRRDRQVKPVCELDG